MADDDDETGTAQHTLELPEFDGIIPVGVLTAITGAGQRIHRAIHHGEKLVLLVEAEVADVRHPKTKEGIKRKHVLSVVDLYEVPGDAGKRMLTHLRQSYRQDDDARNGRRSLLGDHSPVLGPKGWTDANGNLLSDEDLAELRGVSFLAAANDPSLDGVDVVFADGGRMRWPSDFGPEPGSRPRVGDFLTDSDDPRQVRLLVDPASGDVLDEWTDDDEDTRLAALEDEARAAEAAEDRAVVASLEERRDAAQASQPWEDYDSYSLGGTKGIIRELTTAAEVEAVIAYEGAHKKRQSVLKVAGERMLELGE